MEVEPLKSMKGEKRNNLLSILYYSIEILICQEDIPFLSSPCFSYSTGLIYPKAECLRLRL